MNKYIVPILITLFSAIYLTYLITYMNVSKNYEEQIKNYEGMKKTFQEEIYNRDYAIDEMDKEIQELRNTYCHCK